MKVRPDNPRLGWTQRDAAYSWNTIRQRKADVRVCERDHCANIVAQPTYVEPRRQSPQFTSHFDSITLRSVDRSGALFKLSPRVYAFRFHPINLLNSAVSAEYASLMQSASYTTVWAERKICASACLSMRCV